MSNSDPVAERTAFFSQVKSLGYEQAFALPGSFYADKDFLKTELAHLYGKQWVCVGRLEEIPEPGDYLTSEVADEPVVLIRGNDGAINAMSNVCTHRGTVLLEGSGNTGCNPDESLQ